MRSVPENVLSRSRYSVARMLAGIAMLSLVACGSGGSDEGSGTPSADSTPPTLGSIVATPSASGATVSWATDEPADSQVDYGATAAYGSSSTRDSSMVNAHSVVLGGLSSATLYHFRVRSRDAAGNLAAGADLTFTTANGADTTSPTVAITAPAANATVSGTITVSANAADNVGVAGVAFRLDGVMIGTEDTTSPFSASWNTTATTNGSHALSAVARDAAGNVTTSAVVNVNVNNPTPDTTPPTVSILAPAGGSTVSGTLTVTAIASDNIGVVGVQFQLDGTSLGNEDLISPYSVSWDTTGANNASHTLTARARDAAGNQTLSGTVNVTVNNAPPPSGAAISVGQVVVDPPTLETIGVSLPIQSGDTNYNASVLVSYRIAGDATWIPALPLLRVRPETLSEEDPTPFNVGEQFAGSIFDVTPDTEYEVMLDVRDPDGGAVVRTALVRTRPVPRANPVTPRAVAVSNVSQLTSALSTAVPGDVITLANGTYTGAIAISRSGTATNPIFIRGQSRDGVIINAPGATYGVNVTGSFVTVENLTIQASSWGMRINSPSNVVARQLRISNVSYGIDGRNGSKRDYYICDNLLEGREAQWPETDSSLWDFEGIVVTGAGHVICYNTLSGFGDALSLHQATSVPNRAIDFYGNDVLWSGDNGIELDFTDRNVRAFRNRFSNAGNHSISFQPIWGGPAYAIRNVIYNSATAPYKFNNEPTGIYVLHNTAVRPGWAWAQYGARADNFIYHNNITIGTTDAVNMTTVISLAQIDYNGWLPNGTFRFTDTWNSFASLQAESPYEHNGRLLNGQPFATTITIPSNYDVFVQPLDATLNGTTNAIDTGVRLPNINDGFAGANPDLGARESGSAAPHYGVR